MGKDEKDNKLEILRHTTAHVMAQAVTELYTNVKLGIGPAIEAGFYYDFQLEVTLVPEDLAKIEAKMAEIVKRNIPLVKEDMPKEQAREIFEKASQPYKVELIESFDDPEVSIYHQGDFYDLCRGPHVESTGEVRAFKLTALAGAYWHGDPSRPMLQRIYGTAFPTQEELDKHLAMLEEAKKRDHRLIGRDLDLFSFQDEGPGFPFFHPKGMIVINELLDVWKKVHRKYGYKEIRTPILLRKELWERSGHWDNYRDFMYFTEIDQNEYALKPMNCPGGLLVYKSHTRSYREFPLRMAELGQVHRHELSGVLHGLFRVRFFTQDDAHIYCTPDQITDEIEGVISLAEELYKVFGFEEWEIELSTRPEKSIGSDEVWETAEASLKNALENHGIDYQLNPGDGAFYGPKIDFHIRDCMGRRWQCGTIQLDFAMPERFDLEYMGNDNQRHRPVMIHRAILGSIERFLGVLIEHWGGALPEWLSPVQAMIVPIADRHEDYAVKVKKALEENNVRAETDFRRESLSAKIRDAKNQKVPFILVAGDKEIEQSAVALRDRQEDKGSMLLEQAVAEIVERTKPPL